MLEGTGTFELTPTQDTVAEGAETLSVAGEATGFTVTGTTVRLTDDEAVPMQVALSVEPGVGGGGRYGDDGDGDGDAGGWRDAAGGYSSDGVGGRVGRHRDGGDGLRGSVGLHGDDSGEAA